MTEAEIESRIELCQRMLATERNLSTIATLNRTIERLIMLEPTEPQESTNEPANPKLHPQPPRRRHRR